MSLNDLMPYENITIGEGSQHDGWGFDNPFAHIGTIAEELINPLPFPNDPIGGERVMNLVNTILPIKHPKK